MVLLFRNITDSLRAILQTVDQSKILKDVATDIAETCPLLPVKE